MVDRLVCLAGGTFVGDGKPAEVLANPAVREVFLGTEVTTSLAGPLAAGGDEPADGARDGWPRDGRPRDGELVTASAVSGAPYCSRSAT